MVYNPLSWANLPDESTPITAERLSHMETQYTEAVKDAKAYTDSKPSGGGSSANLVSKLRYPVYIAHRGASGSYPEHSIEAYRESFRGGFTPEADVWSLASGKLVCIHDATTTRTMSISKAVSSVTDAEWVSATVKPPTHPTGRVVGTGKGTPVYFEDYLDEFGGKTVLWPEAKVTGETATAVIAAVVERGLQQSTVIQSSDIQVCKDIVAAGCHALLLTNTVSPSTISAAGIEFVGVSLAATNTYVSSLVDAGVKPIAYTANTKADADAQLARGCVGVFSDVPWEVSRRITPETSITELEKGWIPRAISHSVEHPNVASPGGHNQKVTVENASLSFTGGRAENPLSMSNAIRLGSLGFGFSTVTVRFWVEAVSPWAGISAPESSWLFGVYLGVQANDDAVNEDPTSSVFSLAMVRRNGEKNAYERRTVGGAVTKLATAAAPTTPYAKPGGRSIPMQFEVKFTPTNITVKNLTLNDADIDIARSSLTIPGAYLTFGSTGANNRIWGISVKEG